MKKFSQINEAKEKLNIQDDSLNYASADQLKKYLEIADKFISPEAKTICQYLIDNNTTYISELSTDDCENALAGFYNKGVPSNPDLKELYKSIGTLNKNNRLLEVPVFQTEEQFDNIISKKVSPDEILLDLTTEKGRNEVAKKYDPLVHKIARSFNGKSNLSYDELYSAGLSGLVEAMNKYGKKTDKNKADDESIKSYTFTSYAAYLIRIVILEEIKNNSRSVRIPTSAQNRERKERGHNTKNNTISGESTVSSHSAKAEDGAKTLFDFMGSGEYADKDLDRADMDKLMKEVYDAIDKEFDEKERDVFYSYYGLNGYEKLKGKELAAKYNVATTSITYYIHKVVKFLKSKKMHDKLLDVYELMKECLHDEEVADRDNEPYYTSSFKTNSENDLVDD